ncbi:hypothetical protein [Alkaliphilus transvaalensis]|uniref:hypothetical protein n=1 Tax=Alkaliphilus transvaalensis TaxID=114628 RepID=UPI00047D79C0|nr:hypothetical protein [Alkaliphilus transvaalensis]
MNWIKRFMTGRYGGDQLSIFLLVLSMIITLIGRLTNVVVISFLSYVPIFMALFRMFSKDINKRRMENYKFAIFISPIYSKLKKLEGRLKGRKTHRYYKCPNCNNSLRVPKGKGKILITCPNCKEKFTKKV